MATLFDHHNKFIFIPVIGSQHMHHGCTFIAECTCHAWRNGVFAVDDTSVNLYAQPGMFGDSFYVVGEGQQF